MLIERLDDLGRGICFKDNKITFVFNALPHEDVDIKITKETSKYNEAKVIKYNKKSIDRVDIKCPYYLECGGCDLLHLNYESELKFKKDKVTNILKKFANVDISDIKLISCNEFNYRNKATLKVKETIGYYKKKSYEIVSIDNCLLLNNKINEVIKELKKYDLKNIYEIVIRVNYKNEVMLVIKYNDNIDNSIKNIDVKTIVLFNNDEFITIKGLGYIIDKIGDYSFIISPDSFFQVNSKCVRLLYDKVASYASLNGSENVLDLYCGTGTIGIYLSKYCKSVLGVEINKYATNDAIKNKELNNISNINFICDDAKNVEVKNIDVVIVDPPRSGLDIKTINYLINSKIKRIVYVSCDPITLARDLKIFSDSYEVKDVTLFNMFPRTKHVESISLLERKSL